MDLFIDEMVRTIMMALAPIIAGVVIAALVQVVRKIGFELTAESRARMEKMVHDAIFLAEEKVSAAIKRNVSPVASKMSIAVEHITNKLPGITDEEARQLVTQELPKLGLGASDFARSVVLAATNDSK